MALFWSIQEETNQLVRTKVEKRAQVFFNFEVSFTKEEGFFLNTWRQEIGFGLIT